MVDVRLAQVEQAFDTARAEGRTLLLPYLTAGLPNPEDSVDLFVAMADAGADGFEIGIPYSDPLMDGPTIHEAGLAALAIPHPASEVAPVVTLSFGISTVIPDGEASVETFVDAADRALYRSKEGGRQRVSFEPGAAATSDVERVAPVDLD